MWKDRKSRAAYALVESILSLLFLSMIIGTMLVPFSQMQEILNEKQEESERWRFVQDYMNQALEETEHMPQIRLSDGQRMEVSWREDDRGLSLLYTSGDGAGEVGVLYVPEE